MNRRSLISALLLTTSMGCARDEVDRTSGLSDVWDLESVEAPVDFEFLGGELFVLGGVERPELWRVVLDASGPRAERFFVEGLPVGRPRLLESNSRLLYVAGEWGPEVFAVSPSGRVIGEPRRVNPSRDFVPWITGEFLQVGNPGRPAVLIEALVPLPWKTPEHRSGWGNLPRTEDERLRRGEVPPMSDVLIDSDRYDQVHAVLNTSGAMVQYDMWGNPTLVHRLPQDMLDVGRMSASKGYGIAPEAMVNGLELSCEGELWATVGENEQRVAVFDPIDYRTLRRARFEFEKMRDAAWSRCGDWVIGLSAKSGRVLLGHRLSRPH